jgi:hypothetical protein
VNVLRAIPVAVVGAAASLLLAAPSLAATSHTAPAGQHSRLAAASKPGNAIAEPSSCQQAQLNGPRACIYATNGYVNGPGVFRQTNPDWGADLGSSDGACNAQTAAPDNHGGWNDCVTSLWNDLSSSVTFYIDDHCSTGLGFPLTIGPGFGLSNLNNFQAPNGNQSYWNNDLSSDILGTGGSC